MKLDDLTSQTIFQQSPISTQIFSPNGDSLMANKAWEKLWGFKHSKIVGYNVLKDKQLIVNGIMPYIKRGFAGETVKVPALKYIPDKTVKVKSTVPYRWVSALIYPVKNAKNEIIHVVLQHQDITDQVTFEEKLRDSENRFKTLTSFAPVGIFQTDIDGNCLYVNNRWCEFAGITAKKALGKGWINALHPEDKDRVFAEWYKAAKSKTEFISEYRFKNKDGKVTWLQGNAVSIKDSKGNITGFLGTINDITMNKVIEAKLTFQADVLKNITDSVIAIDLQGKITYWNNGAEELFGYNAHEMLGKSPAMLYVDIDSNELSKDLAAINKGTDYIGEWKGKRKDGRIIWIDIKTTQLTDANNNPIGYIGVSNDITERKQVEQALRESEERLRLALNAGAVGVWDWDIINNKITWSDKIFEIHGIKKEDFKGTVDEFMNVIFPDDKKYVTERMEKAFDNKEPYHLEFRAYGPHKKVVWIYTRAQIVFDDNKRAIRMLGATIDITKRKQLEKQKDEFIGLASHELKTPVTSIKAYTQVLEHTFFQKGDNKSARLLQKMDMQINKLAMLISDLLDVTKIVEGKLAFRKSDFDFNTLVREITEEVQRTNNNHTIRLKLDKTKTLYGDQNRYGQVLTNFLTNAMKYSPNNKDIIVKTTITKHELILSVTDFGKGIPKDKLEQVFEKFFRVHQKIDTYPGLGLGLYISKEIVERQGGRIWVESKEGVGSIFSVSIPLTQN